MQNPCLLALALSVTALSGCAMFSPYTPVAEISCKAVPVPLPNTGRFESCHYSKEFEKNAQTTAYYSSGSVVTLAGVLGLGAYKSIVASSGHQYVALAAGGGALYGSGLALYKPTREQVWMAGSAALSCLDSYYQAFDPAVGEHYFNLLGAQKDSVQAEYLKALVIAEAYDEQYKANTRYLASYINKLMSTLQPTTAESYAAVAGAVKESVVGIKKDDFATTKATLTSKAGLKFALWVVGVIERDAEIREHKLEPQCKVFSSDFVIAEFPIDGKLKLKKDEKKTFTILDGSGFFSIKKTPDSASVLATFESTERVRKIVIEGKVVTTDPVFVTFIDSEPGVSRTFEVTVTP